MPLTTKIHAAGYVLTRFKDAAEKGVYDVDAVHGENTDTLTIGQGRMDIAYLSHTPYQASQVLKGIRSGKIDAGADKNDDLQSFVIMALMAHVNSHLIEPEDIEQLQALAAVETAIEETRCADKITLREKDVVVTSARGGVNALKAFQATNPNYFVFSSESGDEQKFMHRTRDDDLDVFLEGDYFNAKNNSHSSIQFRSGLRTATRFKNITDMLPIIDRFRSASYPCHVSAISYSLLPVAQRMTRQRIIDGAVGQLSDVARNAYERLVPSRH